MQKNINVKNVKDYVKDENIYKNYKVEKQKL